MLCSRCSETVKPVVAIDIDGTLGDYHGHFIEFALRYTGKNDGFKGSLYRSYNGTYRFSEWFCNMFSIDLSIYRDIKLAYRQGGMKRSMPIFLGAQALCWSAIDAGAELWVTTTRPYLSLDNIVPDTVEWLRRHEITYSGLLFDEDKYERLADRVDSGRVVAVLDDLGEMYDAAAGAFGSHVPILVSGSYNYNVNRPIKASLDACADIVKARIEEWGQTHAG